jgi:hypothetical protein
MRERAEAIAQELAKGKLRTEPGKASLVATRSDVQRAWLAVGDILVRNGYEELGTQTRRFASEMLPPRTESEQIAYQLNRVRTIRGRNPTR